MSIYILRYSLFIFFAKKQRPFGLFTVRALFVIKIHYFA